MDATLSRTQDTASCAENWHAGAQPDAFGSLVADLTGNFASLGPEDWPGSALAAQAAIERHIAKADLLDGMRYVMRCTGYSRVLLHADQAGRYSVLGLIWPPGCVTPIHAHLAWCAIGMHNGVLEEETFAPWQDGESAPGELLATRTLFPGQTCSDSSSGRFVHRLANRSAGFAMSLHVYGVSQRNVTDGVNRILSDK